MKYLRVRETDVANVWDVRLPVIMHRQAAKSERDSIVKTLLDRLPFLALYSRIDCPADRELCWSFPTATDILSTLESLFERWLGTFLLRPQYRRISSAHRCGSD